jgi:hypothetical protein
MREGIGSLARILKTIEVSSRTVLGGYWSCTTVYSMTFQRSFALIDHIYAPHELSLQLQT